MNQPHFPHSFKPIAKSPRTSSNNLLHKLKRKKLPSSILSTLKHIPEITPESIRELKFDKLVNCKSMSVLAKKQNIETLRMSLDLSQEIDLKRRDTEMTRESEECEQERKCNSFWMRGEELQNQEMGE